MPPMMINATAFFLQQILEMVEEHGGVYGPSCAGVITTHASSPCPPCMRAAHARIFALASRYGVWESSLAQNCFHVANGCP